MGGDVAHGTLLVLRQLRTDRGGNDIGAAQFLCCVLKFILCHGHDFQMFYSEAGISDQYQILQHHSRNETGSRTMAGSYCYLLFRFPSTTRKVCTKCSCRRSNRVWRRATTTASRPTVHAATSFQKRNWKPHKFGRWCSTPGIAASSVRRIR